MKAKFLALAALVLGMVSCQNDFDGANVGNKGEVDLTLSVAVPEMETRAAGNTSDEGGLTNIDLVNEYDIRYILEVYDANGDLAKERMYSFEDTAANTTFNLRLVPGRGYSFVVWADFVPQVDERDAAKSYDYHYNTSAGLTKVMVVKDHWTAIDESRDAYTGKHFEADFRSSSSILVTLTRPFAKLRVVTTDIKELYGDLMPETVKVNYLNTYFYNEFNALKQDVEGQPEATDEKVVNLNTMTYKNENPKGTGVMTLFADYFFRATDDRVMFTMDVQDNTKQDIPTIVFNTNIPVKRNYLTTVMGPVLTDANSISVTIEEGFANGKEWNPEDDKYDVEVWDGKTLNAPVDSNNDGIYEIGTGAQLAYLAAAVNGTLPSTASTRAGEVDWAKEEFILTANIDLDNNNWTPIGNSTNTFQGTFDGKGKTIYNLLITGNNSYVGLFGFTTNGEIKNLVVENAKVSGYVGVGVVAGSPYTSKFNDITVQGHVEVNGLSYVGGVGGRNAYASWNNITVNVDETSYVNANSIENGTAYRTYVGGVIGFIGEDPKLFKNITSNIDVKGSTCDVGGLFGIAHYGNQFENCSCSGDVEIYAAEEAEEAQEIGGIAGVWHNGGADVVFTNCTFTGTLKTNIAVDFYYDGLIGKPYSATGTGKLIIDGYEVIANGVGMKDGEYYMQSVAGLKWLAEQVNGGNNFSNKVVKLATDLDLNNEEWTPIGNSTYSFQGTFDGQDHKIANLLITGNKSDVGLFGFTTNGEIKNLVVENAKVSGYLNVAVVAGTPYTSKYNNITVQGHVEINGFAYVGAVGGKNAYADWTNITVNVDETSYVNANSIEGSTAYRTYVGGVCGFNGEGGHSFKNITSNINVKGSTIDVGGLFGIAHYGNQFENCSCSGDVEIYAAEEAEEAQEIGGIAGVWHNKDGQTVTMTNCTFTGTLKTNIADVDFYYGGLIGKPYSETGTGKLIIDGYIIFPGREVHAETGLYWNGETKPHKQRFYVQNAEELAKATAYFAGQSHSNEANVVTIDLVNDINLAGVEWNPWSVMFITVNGNNHTISNLSNSFFGYAGAVTVNDLTLENVTASGNQAGTFAASAEGAKFFNCFLKGNNKVTFVDDAKVENGVGAISGITVNSNLNVTITEGTNVEVDMNTISNTEKTTFDNILTGYKHTVYATNSGTITNNGNVSVKVAEEIVANSKGTGYSGELFEEGLSDDFFVLQNSTLTGDAKITLKRTYDTVALEGVTANINDNLIVAEVENTIILHDCDITLAEGKKLIVTVGGATIGQVMIHNVKVNGETLTQQSAANFMEGVNWYEVW